MINFRNDKYLEMPQVKSGQLIIFIGREEDVDVTFLMERPLPHYLWSLHDVKNSERSLYFVDEASLHYFISENIGIDIHHTQARVLRRNGSSFIKRRIQLSNPDNLCVKDFSKISLTNNFTVNEVRLISKVVKLPSNRLKEQDSRKELLESKG